jgi:hypothetical protein
MITVFFYLKPLFSFCSGRAGAQGLPCARQVLSLCYTAALRSTFFIPQTASSLTSGLQNSLSGRECDPKVLVLHPRIPGKERQEGPRGQVLGSHQFMVCSCHKGAGHRRLSKPCITEASVSRLKFREELKHGGGGGWG